MHRQGILVDQINEAVKMIKKSRFLELEGICSHLADADNRDDSFTKSQIEKWKKVVATFKNNFQNIKYFHLAASAGVPYSQLQDDNIIRLGIGLYGINCSPLIKLNLRPVLQLQSVVSSV